MSEKGTFMWMSVVLDMKNFHPVPFEFSYKYLIIFKAFLLESQIVRCTDLKQNVLLGLCFSLTKVLSFTKGIFKFIWMLLTCKIFRVNIKYKQKIFLGDQEDPPKF